MKSLSQKTTHGVFCEVRLARRRARARITEAIALAGRWKWMWMHAVKTGAEGKVVLAAEWHLRE